MSRRNMSERMCIGLMLCETVPCVGGGSCVLPTQGTAVPQNESINDFQN